MLGAIRNNSTKLNGRDSQLGVTKGRYGRAVQWTRVAAYEGMQAGLCQPLSGPCCGSLCSTISTKVFPAARLKKQNYCTYSWS